MQGMKYVFGKELTRVFKDRKMIFSLFILPVILTVGLYGLLGSLITGMQDDIDQHEAVVTLVDAPDSFQTFLAETGAVFEMISEHEDEPDYFLAAKEAVLEGTLDLIIEFPPAFEEQVKAYETGMEVPQVRTYYNPSEEYSSAAYAEYVGGYLEQYRQMLLEERTGDLSSVAVFYVDVDNPEQIIQDDERAAGQLLGMLVPYMISILLFAGAMSLGIDAIAGEKERGTLATMLLAPIDRTAIVLGKLFSLMVISGISAATYVLGLVLAMPLLMGSAMTEGDMNLNVSFTAGQILEIAGVLILQVFLYVVLISLVSVFARNVKEGSTYISPVYIVVIGLGMVTMYSTAEARWFEYCIPLYNSSLALKNIFTRDLTVMQFLLTMISNLLAGSIITGVIVKAFKSERVMFHA